MQKSSVNNLQHIIALPQAIGVPPPLTHDIVEKIIERKGEDLQRNQAEIYDILTQALREDEQTLPHYIQRAHKTNPHITHALYRRFSNTDKEDLEKMMQDMHQFYAEHENIYTYLAHHETGAKRVGNRSTIGAWAKKYFADTLLAKIEEYITIGGRDRLYEASLVIGTQGIYFNMERYGVGRHDEDTLDQEQDDSVTNYIREIFTSDAQKMTIIRSWIGNMGSIYDAKRVS